jgi:hypothetical protein
MPICIGCKWLEKLRCKSPQARFNGGLGLKYDGPEPSVAMMDGTRGGKRVGWTQKFYASPVVGCSGKETDLKGLSQSQSGRV